MKICLYSPYVPKHVGGGEKFFFDVARTLVELGHDVFVGVTRDLHGEFEIAGQSQNVDNDQVPDHAQIRQQYETFLGRSLAQVKFIYSPLNGAASFWQKLLWTRQWDVLYYSTDGSLFFSLAPKNVLHIQIPFTDQKQGLLERLKLMNWSSKNTNSDFTKQVVEKNWRTTIDFVHHPMIDPPPVPADLMAKKEKIILHVGRFFRQLHSKRQDVLVNIFKELLEKHPQETKGWELVLIGGVEDQQFADEVKQMAQNFPIQLVEANRQQLWQYYQRASIYWHATGFGLNEAAEPAKMEHFGISTVEAMAMGCVPVVIGQGGQVEVVGPELKELLWKTPAECIAITMRMIMNPNLRAEKAAKAQKRAQQFGATQFKNILTQIINSTN